MHLQTIWRRNTILVRNTEWINVISNQLQRLAFQDLVDLEAQAQSPNIYA